MPNQFGAATIWEQITFLEFLERVIRRSSAVAADCEVKKCGVVAIGRCDQCGQAFCTSHRAYSAHGRPIVDQCISCWGINNANLSRLENATAIEACRKMIRALAADLEQRGTPKEKYYHSTQEVAGWFARRRSTAHQLRAEAMGRTRTVENPEGHQYGWFVGEFPWRFTVAEGRPYGGGIERYQITMKRTFVAPDGSILPEGESSELYSKQRMTTVTARYEVEPPERHLTRLDQIIGRLTELAQR